MLQVTNIQTFESVQHAGGLFQTAMDMSTNTNTTTTIGGTPPDMLQGSIHRGFLNAYSRTERGSILNLCHGSSKSSSSSSSSLTNCTSSLPKESILHRRYRHCRAEKSDSTNDGMLHEHDFDQYDVVEAERRSSSTANENQTDTSIEATLKHQEESIIKKRGRRGCKIQNTKLMTILRELVTDYLSDGRSVLVAGHSLGGSVATVLALDILIHFPTVPVDHLQLWTFGGAQVTDNGFLESALALVPRLQHFLKEQPASRRAWARRLAFPTSSFPLRSQFHRFVSKCVL
jgi:hypothetical protein